MFLWSYPSRSSNKTKKTAIMANSTMKRPMNRKHNREFHCPDYPDFTPNLSPAEMFQAGIFGGTYFCDVKIHGKWYRKNWKEFEPHGWFDNLDIPTLIASTTYRVERNKYKAQSGRTLNHWVKKGWIKPEFDTHGWVHWYCRFFLGRRCEDDERQISRWRACAGKKGRWKRNLIAKCAKAGKSFDDASVSPKVRQLLLHWAYELTEDDFRKYKSLLEKGQKTSFIPQHEMRHVVKKRAHSSESEQDIATKEAQALRTREAQDEERNQRRLKRSRNR